MAPPTPLAVTSRLSEGDPLRKAVRFETKWWHMQITLYGRITFCWVHWLQNIAMVNLFFLDILSPFAAGMIRQCLHSETKQAHDSNVFESLSPPWHTCSCTRARCFRAFGKYAWCPSQKKPKRMAVTHQPWVLVDHLAAWVAISSLVPQGIVWCNVMYPIANPWQQTMTCNEWWEI